MADKKTVVFELCVTLDAGDKLVARAQEVALRVVDFNADGDFHLNEVPTRVYPNAEDEALAKEFINSSPTEKGDLVEEKVMTHNPTVEEYESSPTPEIKSGPSIGLEKDPLIEEVGNANG